MTKSTKAVNKTASVFTSAPAPQGVSRRTFGLAAVAAGSVAALGIPTLASADDHLVLPDLKTMDGQNTDMFDHIVAGKWNLVMLWSVTCGICAKETPRLSELYEEEKGGNLTLLGLSIDGTEQTPAVQQWMDRHSMSFPNLVGEFASIALNFEGLTQEPLRGTPTFLMFDPEGKLAAVNPGPVRPQAVRDFVAKRS